MNHYNLGMNSLKSYIDEFMILNNYDGGLHRKTVHVWRRMKYSFYYKCTILTYSFVIKLYTLNKFNYKFYFNENQ
jgi:hypothetical protein